MLDLCMAAAQRAGRVRTARDPCKSGNQLRLFRPLVGKQRGVEVGEQLPNLLEVGNLLEVVGHVAHSFHQRQRLPMVRGEAGQDLGIGVGDAARARKWRDFDRWLTAPAICFFIAFVWLVLFRLPLALYNRPGQTEINLAEQAGQQAEEAMQRYFAQHQRYTASLDDLRSVDPTIDPDREVEFKFVVATDSRYKFQTKYPGTAKVFQFTNQGVTPWDLKVTYPDDWEERESQF